MSPLTLATCGIAGLLVAASAVGAVLALLGGDARRRDTVANLNDRLRAWWVMCVAVLGALWLGPVAATVLFAIISFLALREMATLTPTRRGDHRTLFWAFFVIIPLQYALVGIGWDGLFTILIPVYGFLFLALRSALRQDSVRYLERTAKIQWATMLTVYCLSHVPALLQLRPTGWTGDPVGLVLFLLLVVQLSDVFQYVWGKLLGRHRVLPHLSPNKTWEGLLGGIATATAIGAGRWWMTPFAPWQAAAMACAIACLGFAGGVVCSAVKRDSGLKDFGRSLPGHGGILDRVDSLTFAAPVFYHLTVFYFARPG
jgi:phosphatidate cytidylyltransferase